MAKILYIFIIFLGAYFTTCTTVNPLPSTSLPTTPPPKGRFLRIKGFVTCVERIEWTKKNGSDDCLAWWAYTYKSRSNDTRSVVLPRDKSTYHKLKTVDGELPPRKFSHGLNKYVFKTIMPCGDMKKSTDYWKINNRKYYLNDFFKVASINSCDESCHKKDSCKKTVCKNRPHVTQPVCKFSVKKCLTKLKLKCKKKSHKLCKVECKKSVFNRKCLLKCSGYLKCNKLCKDKSWDSLLRCRHMCYKSSNCCKKCLKYTVDKVCLKKCSLRCCLPKTPMWKKKCQRLKKLKCRKRSRARCYIRNKTTFHVKTWRSSTNNTTHERCGANCKHTGDCHNMHPLKLPHGTSPTEFYAYNTVNPYSIGSGLETEFFDELKNHMWIVPLLKKHTNEMYYVFNLDVPNDGTGGESTLKIKYPGGNWGSNTPLVPGSLDDPSVSNDLTSWDPLTKTLTVKLVWQPCCSDGFIVKAPKNGCLKITLGETSGIKINKFKVVGVINKPTYRRVVKTFSLSTNALCSGCSGCKHSNFWGIKPCKFYDRCGICNGDGSKCKTVLKCKGCSTNLVHKTTCDLKYKKGSDDITFKVSGLFTKNYTDVKATFVGDCGENTPWNSTTKLVYDDLYKKKLYKTIKFHDIKTCLKNGHGTILISGFKNVNNTGKYLYIAPCNFHVFTKGKSCVATHFKTRRISCKVKIKKIMWLSPKNPRYPLIIFWTFIKRLHGHNVKLSSPRIERYTPTDGPHHDWKIVNKTDISCFNNNDMSTCKQAWVLRLNKPNKGIKRCIRGRLVISFLKKKSITHRGEKKYKRIKVVLNIQKLCPPASDTVVRKRPCKIKLFGPYYDSTMAKPLKIAPAGKRVYFFIASKRRSKIVYLRICHIKPLYGLPSHIKSCSDKRALKYTIYDRRMNFNGNKWKTIIEPIHRHNFDHVETNHTVNGYKQGFSFKSLMFEDMGYSNNYVIEAYAVCHSKICQVNTMNLFDDTYGSSDDIQYNYAMQNTWHNKDESDCASGDMCSRALIPIGCPSGHFFFKGQSNSCNSKFDNSCNHEPYTCVKYSTYGSKYILVPIYLTILIFLLLQVIYPCMVAVEKGGQMNQYIKINNKPNHHYDDNDDNNRNTNKFLVIDTTSNNVFQRKNY